LHCAEDVGHPSSAAISLTVNGLPRQSSDIAKLIWSVAECVAYLSEYEALEPGDLIMTGTPEGVNAVVAGDVMRGEVQGLGSIEVRVVE
jgi:fumarylpyruvate hydrolase